MRAWWAVALGATVAIAGAAAPVAGQQGKQSTQGMGGSTPSPKVEATSGALNTTHGSAAPIAMAGKRQWGSLLTYQVDALRSSQELTAHKSPGRNKLDMEALGKALTGEENQLSTLEPMATGANGQALAQAHAHERQARTHYQALLHGGWDARHAAALHQELQLVDRALHRSGGDPSTSTIVIHRAFGGHPRDTSSNVIRRAIP